MERARIGLQMDGQTDAMLIAISPEPISWGIKTIYPYTLHARGIMKSIIVRKWKLSADGQTGRLMVEQTDRHSEGKT